MLCTTCKTNERFAKAFPEGTVSVEHTGGGCFWLAFRFGDDPKFYVATDGNAGLPTEGEDTPLATGGWRYVGRHDDTEDESNEDYEGTVIVEAQEEDALSDEQVVEAIRSDLAARAKAAI